MLLLDACEGAIKIEVGGGMGPVHLPGRLDVCMRAINMPVSWSIKRVLHVCSDHVCPCPQQRER